MIINRYILKEVLYTLVAVIVVLLLIFISNRFIGFLADASVGELSSDVILRLLTLKTLGSMVIILPLALFLSILLAFSRLYKDNEMVAMAACGVSVRKIYGTVSVFAFLIALVVAAISFYLAPWAEEQSYRIQDIEKSSTELGGIIPGRFTETETAQGVFYVSEYSEDRSKMKDVFVQTERNGQQVILSSKTAHQLVDQRTGDRYIVMEDGYRYEGVPGKPDFKIIKYDQNAMRIEEQQIIQSYRKHRARPTASLIGSGDSRDIAELQWRISMPLSVILLALLAVPLSRTTPRQGRYAKLFIAIMIYVIYNNLMGIGNSWVEDGKVTAMVGMWWVHLLLLFGVWLLLVNQYGIIWVLKAMVGRTSTA